MNTSATVAVLGAAVRCIDVSRTIATSNSASLGSFEGDSKNQEVDNTKFERNCKRLEHSSSWKMLLNSLSKSSCSVRRRYISPEKIGKRHICSFPSHNKLIGQHQSRLQVTDRRAYSSTEIMLEHKRQRQCLLHKRSFSSNRSLRSSISILSYSESFPRRSLPNERIKESNLTDFSYNVDTSFSYLMFALLITLKIDGLLDILVTTFSKLVAKNPRLNNQLTVKAILSLKNDPILLRMRSQRGVDYSISHIYRQHDNCSLQERCQYPQFVPPSAEDESVWGHFTDIDAGSISSLRDFVSWNPTCLADDTYYVEDLAGIDEDVANRNHGCYDGSSNSSEVKPEVEDVSSTLESFFGLS